MLLDILLPIADKILSKIVKRFIPLVKVKPSKLSFKKSDWRQRLSFNINNTYNEVIFDIYVLLDISGAKTDDFELIYDAEDSNLKINITKVDISYSIIRLNCTYENGNDFILLKIHKMDPGTYMPFVIASNSNIDVKLKILKYSKQESTVLDKSNGVALSFELPLKKGSRASLKGVGLVMKKGS